MAERSLRFGVSNGAGLRGSTWKLWTATGGGQSSVYLACRGLGGEMKSSLHESGQWRLAYSSEMFESRVKGFLPQFQNRVVTTWKRPAEIAPGITLAYRIVTPSSGVTSKVEPSDRDVIWIPNASAHEATEVDIFLSAP